MSSAEIVDRARYEGLRELEFRERALLLCAVLPWLQIVTAVCILEVGESVPANVTLWGYHVVVVSVVNFLVLLVSWFVLRKRGTGKHHLVAAVVLSASGIATTLLSYWYGYLLISHKTRIEAIW
ncbi:hypothetical protein OIV83_006201 [Microbotryomycetes sp. JL201]|nr:hypothetical protein OIV83_006201 [Microbotryomycetes sp. JL201]